MLQSGLLSYLILLLLLEKFVKQGVEGGILTHDGLHNLAVGTDDNLCGESLNAVVAEHLRVARVVDMQPGQLVLCDGLFPLGKAGRGDRYFRWTDGCQPGQAAA